jgi:hypothetical protein
LFGALAVLACLGTFVAFVAAVLPSLFGVSRSEAAVALFASAGVTVLVLTSVLTWFAYCHRSVPIVRRTASTSRPKRVAFVVAFSHVTPKEQYLQNEIVAGLANKRLAEWVRQEAQGFCAVLTQEAVIRAFDASSADCGPRPATTIGKTPVFPMHKHDPHTNVRTLATLACALDRMKGFDGEFALVLVAHPGHVERAGRALSVLYSGAILDTPDSAGLLRDMPYSRAGSSEPLQWAVRELLFARPIEFGQRAFTRLPWRWCRPACPAEVSLGPIDWKEVLTPDPVASAPARRPCREDADQHPQRPL